MVASRYAYLAAAFNGNGIDSVNDFASDPLAISPTINIPYEGSINGAYTERTFFSSIVRLQGNGWDDFVARLRDMNEDQAFVIRLVAEPGSGVIIRDDNAVYGVPTLSYSTNTAAEAEFLDIGDTRVTYLTSTQAASFHGLLLRGHWRREWGTNSRLSVEGTRDSTVLIARALTIPFQESQLAGTFILGVDTALIAQYPRLTWVASNPLPIYEGYVTWRGDTLTAYYRR